MTLWEPWISSGFRDRLTCNLISPCLSPTCATRAGYLLPPRLPSSSANWGNSSHYLIRCLCALDVPADTGLAPAWPGGVAPGVLGGGVGITWLLVPKGVGRGLLPSHPTARDESHPRSRLKGHLMLRMEREEPSIHQKVLCVPLCPPYTSFQ